MDLSTRFVAPGQNRLLALLPRELQLRLLPRMEKVSLPIRQSLYELDAPITHVWFPLSGVMSIVVTLRDGASVEVATVGNEGILGTAVYLGAERASSKAFCQVAGQALRMPVDAFKRSLQEAPQLGDLVRRYTQAMITQMSQSIACNHTHSVPQRMCRWLLMTHDRVGADEFHLTQEFLAQMLGVRRPSVTVAALALQKSGLISYQRGRIRIVDRAALERTSCECYEVVRREFSRLLGAPVGAPMALSTP
jgi:CRP-like cAMP-binding protein